ncbi:hypothetical protein [Streptomyces zaomyceticus]|uniref:hypothetical protein n=1 Tax=Streptomyces zaomyceticus TaxID=68286 RepID=UPI00379CDB1D
MSTDLPPDGKRRSTRSIQAEAEFRTRLTELGAELLDEWKGDRTPHRVRCAQGHACTPRPSNVRKGNGVCRTCAGNDRQGAEAAFRARLADLGATLLEPQYLGSGKPHRARCDQGHDCAPRPNDMQKGKGICQTCAGNGRRSAEAAFRARLAELGVTLLETRYLGKGTGHRARCAVGHDCAPTPNAIQQGRGFCRACRGPASLASEAAFRARLTEAGATLLESGWLGHKAPHRVRCVQGHEVTPRPNSLHQGQGVCRVCAGQVWDAFYVVRNDGRDVIKFGITSGDPRPRLADHAREGLDTVLRVHRDLPGNVARELELTILAALADACEAPVQGREFFHARVLPLVLDLVDHHPAVRATS